MMQKRIMFVCLGNICRSPMAEFIFKDIIKERHLENRFFVASAATSDEETRGEKGNPMDIRAQRVLQAHDIAFSERHAVQVQKDDYEKYDLFVVMDEKNVRNILRIFGGDPENKVKKLMDYTQCGGDVADPWYSGNFELAYRDIYLGCQALLEHLMK